MSFGTRAGRPTPLAAVLQGKLGQVRQSEDFTTAMVFGTLAWLPFEHGLGPSLARVEPKLQGIDNVTHATVELWPWWDRDTESKGAEPDVVITLHRADELPMVLVVEAKRGAKLGYRQLERQAINGRIVAGQTQHFAGVIYLTEHVGQPPEFQSERSKMPQGVQLHWLSWRDLAPVLEDAAHAKTELPDILRALASDADQCLKRWNLVRYQGFATPSPITGWTFPKHQATP